MIPTVPIDVLLSFLVGELCALLGPQAAGARSPWGPAFRYALAFSAFVFFPIGLILMTFYPAWSWMYFLDPRAYPPLFGLLAVYCYVLALVAGYGLCARYVTSPKARRVALIVPLVMLIALMGTTLNRLWYVGSYEDWLDGRATPILESSLAWVMTLIVIAFFWGLAATLRAISRLSERAQADER